MFILDFLPKLLNIVAQEIMSEPEKLIKVIAHYQQALEHYAKRKNDAKMLHCIFKLSHMPITRRHLEETGVGRTVNSLRRLDEVGDAARSLVAKWKDMVSKQEEDDEEEGEEVVQNIKSGTSKDAARKSGQRDKTEDNRSNSSHRSSDKNSDKGDRHSNHKKEKHKEVSNLSKGNHISSSHKEHKERQPKERRRSYERHSENDDSEGSQKDQVRAHHVSKDLSDSEGSASNEESPSDRTASTSEDESDGDGNPKLKNSSSSKVEGGKHARESRSKEKQPSSNNSDRKSHRSTGRERSNSKERRRSKSKEQSRDKSRDKKRDKGSKKDSAKRKRECSDSSDSEEMHKKHRSSESSKRKRYDSSSDSASSQQTKDTSDDESYSASPKKDASKKDGDRKEKERKESHRSGSHHGSSKAESRKHWEKERSSDGKKKEKSSRESTKYDKKSDKKSKQEGKSKSKPISKEIITTENGICSSFGASFADALGMLEPTTSKGVKKSKPHTTTSTTPEKSKPEKSPDKKQQPLKPDVPLPSLPSKLLEPVDVDLSSLLPAITPNYRPLGNYIESVQNSRSKILNDDEALSMVMSSKNQRTKVYSGNKIMWDTVPTLFELCTRILQDNIDALEYTGGVPYCILKPVLDKATPDQLFVMEHHNPYLMEDTDELWQLHCQREFRNKQREEMETWREMYMRCLDEREAKLKTLKANIKQSQEQSTPVRKTQLAYVDSVVKPPRNVLKKQMKTGIEKRPTITPASRLTALATSGAAGQICVPNPGSRASSSGGGSAHIKPKKAPLMQKTLQFLKGGRFRR